MIQAAVPARASATCSVATRRPRPGARSPRGGWPAGRRSASRRPWSVRPGHRGGRPPSGAVRGRPWPHPPARDQLWCTAASTAGRQWWGSADQRPGRRAGPSGDPRRLAGWPGPVVDEGTRSWLAGIADSEPSRWPWPCSPGAPRRPAGRRRSRTPAHASGGRGATSLDRPPASAATTTPAVDGLPGMPPVTDPADVYAAAAPACSARPRRAAKPLVYVPQHGSNDVRVIDPATYQVVDRFPAARRPQHVVPSYDLRTLYATERHRRTALTPIDPRTGKPGADPGPDPYNLYFTPDGRYAIVVAEARAGSTSTTRTPGSCSEAAAVPTAPASTTWTSPPTAGRCSPAASSPAGCGRRRRPRDAAADHRR